MLLKDLSDLIAGNFGKITDLEFRRRCEDLIITNRAEIIRRNIDKYQITPNNFIQQINCLSTTSVNISECCSVNLGCDITRSSVKIPKPIRIRNRNSNFIYVGTIDSKKSYSYMTIEEFELLQCERFIQKNTAIYFYVNGYLYIYGDSPQNIRIKGVFNDPRKVENLNDCDSQNQDCIDNIEIDDDIATIIRLMVIDELKATTRPEEIETEIELENGNANTT